MSPHPRRIVCQGSASTSGFTVVELTIALVVATAIALILVITITTGHNASSSLNSRLDQAEDLRRCLRRISDEVRTASRLGEDTNESKSMENGEDRNGNGRLDSDWALTPSSITFNRLLAIGAYSLPITYRMDGTNLVREQWSDPTGKKTSTVMASSVAAFTVTEERGKIIFELALEKSLGGERKLTAVQAISVTPRN